MVSSPFDEYFASYPSPPGSGFASPVHGGAAAAAASGDVTGGQSSSSSSYPPPHLPPSYSEHMRYQQEQQQQQQQQHFPADSSTPSPFPMAELPFIEMATKQETEYADAASPQLGNYREK